MSNNNNDNDDHPKQTTAGSILRNCTWFIVVVLLPIAVSVIMNLELFVDIETPPPDYGSGSMFDTIASRYDMINRVLALRMDIGWRRRMIRVIKARLDEKQIGEEKPVILDLATGTADVALMIANEIPNAIVWGSDPSNGMLFVGRDKVKKANLQDRVTLLWGDARDLYMFQDNYYDAATMAFGIRNVPEREKALCEIHRVLKKGATFCVLEFSEPDDSAGFLGSVARGFIRHIIPVVGGVLSGKPREYLHLQNSIKDFPEPKEFGNLLENLQCSSSPPEENNTQDLDEEEEKEEVAKETEETTRQEADVDKKKKGAFVLDDLIQLNFGSVQLYVTTAV